MRPGSGPLSSWAGPSPHQAQGSPLGSRLLSRLLPDRGGSSSLLGPGGACRLPESSVGTNSDPRKAGSWAPAGGVLAPSLWSSLGLPQAPPATTSTRLTILQLGIHTHLGVGLFPLKCFLIPSRVRVGVPFKRTATKPRPSLTGGGPLENQATALGSRSPPQQVTSIPELLESRKLAGSLGGASSLGFSGPPSFFLPWLLFLPLEPCAPLEANPGRLPARGSAPPPWPPRPHRCIPSPGSWLCGPRALLPCP